MRILDAHVHFNGNAAGADEFVSRWRQRGIEKAVVFGLTRGDGWHPSLKEVGDLAQRFADFIIPFGYITPGHGDSLAEAREAIARGFRGLKFIFPARPYDEDEYFPIYEAAAAAGMVCLFHTGIVVNSIMPSEYQGDYQRAWRVSSNYMRPAHLDRIARSFPELKIIGAHLGGGAWYEEAAQVMRWNPNVYFDLCIGQMHYYRKNAPPGEDARAIRPRIKEMYDTGQLDLAKIIFGTDGVIGSPSPDPGWSLGAVEFELNALGATEAQKDAIRWTTAAHLLGIE